MQEKLLKKEEANKNEIQLDEEKNSPQQARTS